MTSHGCSGIVDLPLTETRPRRPITRNLAVNAEPHAPTHCGTCSPLRLTSATTRRSPGARVRQPVSGSRRRTTRRDGTRPRRGTARPNRLRGDTVTRSESDLVARIRPQRTITGMSAVLLAFTPDGDVDWTAVEAHVARTVAAGLTPAVNMDTGYVQLLDVADKARVLDLTAEVTGGDFVAGAYVADEPGVAVRPRRLPPAVWRDRRAGRNARAVPLVRAQHARRRRMGGGPDVDRHPCRSVRRVRTRQRCSCPTVGSHRSTPTRAMMGIGSCASGPSIRRSVVSSNGTGSTLRDRVRPDFTVFTGNDLAIDMVMYGSDYLLGLSTFAPRCVRRSRPAVGCRRSGVPRVERPVAVPRQFHVPRTRPRVPPRRGDLLRVAGLGAVRRHAAAGAASTRLGSCCAGRHPRTTRSVGAGRGVRRECSLDAGEEARQCRGLP